METVLPVGLEFYDVWPAIFLSFRGGKAQSKVFFRPPQVRPADLVAVAAFRQDLSTEALQELLQGHPQYDQVFVFRLDNPAESDRVIRAGAGSDIALAIGIVIFGNNFSKR